MILLASERLSLTNNRSLTVLNQNRNSWYPVVYDEFLVPPKEYSYSVSLLPLNANDETSVVVQSA
jgi:hypothetical protein